MPVADWQNAGFGLYVHWPFCQSKCPYCDFNSHVAARIDHDRWADAYVRQIRACAEQLPDRKLDTVYFGGGTPSLMAPETVRAILQTVRSCWAVANDWEVTLEANPTSVEARHFGAYRAAGVNRVSLGVQSLRDNDLRRLGRLHSASDAVAAFEIARAEFDRVSFDLIYARQDQSLADWRAELEAALDMAIDHLSLYQLTIESGTAFGDRMARGGLAGLPGEDLSADMYELTVERCADAGLELYEVSNFARPGYESRHNMLYWTGGDYLGIGPGAHGRLTIGPDRWATVCASDPSDWLDSAERSDGPAWTADRLSPRDRTEEYLMMGLRISAGLSYPRLMDLNGPTDLPKKIERLAEDGFLLRNGDVLRATPRGRLLLNAVLRELICGG